VTGLCDTPQRPDNPRPERVQPGFCVVVRRQPVLCRRAPAQRRQRESHSPRRLAVSARLSPLTPRTQERSPGEPAGKVARHSARPRGRWPGTRRARGSRHLRRREGGAPLAAGAPWPVPRRRGTGVAANAVRRGCYRGFGRPPVRTGGNPPELRVTPNRTALLTHTSVRRARTGGNPRPGAFRLARTGETRPGTSRLATRTGGDLAPAHAGRRAAGRPKEPKSRGANDQAGAGRVRGLR